MTFTDRKNTPLNDLCVEIDAQTRERLSHPVVINLYEFYVRTGMLKQLSQIIGQIPQANQEPIVHTLSSHVTKEKPVFVYTLSPQSQRENQRAQTLGACVDLLWCLSLMYDDMADQDTQRSGTSAAWIEFGADATQKSLESGLRAVFQTLANTFGPSAVAACQADINRGIASIQHHKQLPLGTQYEALLLNYQERANFHTSLPVHLLHLDTTNSDTHRQKAITAICAVNLGGQILNDIKDFLAQFSWQRPGFSDVRNGLVTVPLNILWQKMGSTDREKFSLIFGKGSLDQPEQDFLLASLSRTGALDLAAQKAEELYRQGFEAFSEVVNPEELQYSQAWINYKLEQLRGIGRKE